MKKDDLFKRIARRLRALQDAYPELGNQQAIAKRSGVGQSTVGRIARAATDPQIGTLADIAGAFGKPVTYLFEEEPSPPDMAVGEPPPDNKVTSRRLSKRQQALVKTLVSGFESGDLTDWDADALQSFLAGRMSAR
ncbi:helix-turn-helix domain-containing protein [Microbulbifer celer]|uniref:Helix-turn-helix domain-containing protein n=1 Tax=Microbulbifer celer TaxID=435905 RepID=A0ABW3U7Q8_9GAMM|nr:helix-turn-helix transcriptional regulator [Microbulbifer celer]UFN58555.1 helix-turn-helix transcriptional regulator [Microbulbifer celer]